MISMICLGSFNPIVAQQAEKLFQQGMMKEEAEGNLTQAIEIYSKLIDDSTVDRSIRANALFHIGICHEKLGEDNALNAYQKIISEYSDQKDIVFLAQKKLQSLKSNSNTNLNKGLISERLEKDVNEDYWLYQFSPDGRYYLYTNTENNVAELMICDLQTGKKDSLTTGNRTGYGFDNTQPWGAKWSPNGKKIAYIWGFWGHSPNKNKINEIHLIDKNGSNKQVILSGKEGTIPKLECFTQDGKHLLGTRLIEENNKKIQHLVLISIANKKFEVLKNFGTLHAGNFSYSPNGKYLLYNKSQLNSKNNDIFVMSLADMKEAQITDNGKNHWEPKWSPKGNQILFLSNKTGSTGLYKINFENGKALGEPEAIKNNLGDGPKIMGVSNYGAVYYENRNTRHDVFTLDLDEKFDKDVYKVTQITNPALKRGGGLAKYSKDGRYISYLGNPNIINEESEEIDFNLGPKYYINIYDIETKKSKLLNLDLYLNHDVYRYMYHVPSWSYHENKLLVHGKIKDNYEGGFFAVDVLTEQITPVLTVPNCKQGTDYKLFGNSMVFSKSNKDKIYYSSPDWKHLMEYNSVTQEEKAIVHIEEGFWFEGFLDDAETKCIARNRFGKFISDVNTKETIKVAEKEIGWTIGTSNDGKYQYYGKYPNKLTRIRIDGSEPDREIIFDEFFQNATAYNMMVLDLHPKKNEILFGAETSSGTEIYKLTNVFD